MRDDAPAPPRTGRPNNIDRLPGALRDRIDALLAEGVPQAEILDRMERPLADAGAPPLSASGLGRYARRGERARYWIDETRLLAAAVRARPEGATGDGGGGADIAPAARDMLRTLVFAALVRESERLDADGEAAPDPQTLDTLSRVLLRVERIEREARRAEREAREAEQAEAAPAAAPEEAADWDAEPAATPWGRRAKAKRLLRQIVKHTYGHDMDAADAARSAQAWVEGTDLPATVRKEYFVAYGVLPADGLEGYRRDERLGLAGPPAIPEYVGARPGHPPPPPKLRGFIPELPEWGLGPVPEEARAAAAAAYGAEAVPVLPQSGVTARAAEAA